MSGQHGRANLRPQAVADVEEIYAYLHERAPDAAERFLDEFKKVAVMLGDFPMLGRARQNKGLPKELRSFPLMGFGPYIIFFLSQKDGVEILRVFHASRDLDRLMREELE